MCRLGRTTDEDEGWASYASGVPSQDWNLAIGDFDPPRAPVAGSAYEPLPSRFVLPTVICHLASNLPAPVMLTRQRTISTLQPYSTAASSNDRLRLAIHHAALSGMRSAPAR